MTRKYERLPSDCKAAVDRAFKATAAALRDAGLVTANDDRAEALVDAITEYVIDSQPGLVHELQADDDDDSSTE